MSAALRRRIARLERRRQEIKAEEVEEQARFEVDSLIAAWPLLRLVSRFRYGSFEKSSARLDHPALASSRRHGSRDRAGDETESLLERYAEQVFRRGTVPRFSLADAVEKLGIQDTGLASALQRSDLFPPGTLLDEDDLEALRGFKVAMDAGFPADAMMQLMRVYADALWRVAEAETRLFISMFTNRRRRISPVANWQRRPRR